MQHESGLPKMRVCLAGNFVPHPDEGVRKIASCIGRELKTRHDVLEIRTKDFRAWREARAFRPDILHFVLSPTTPGLAAARLLSCYCPKAKTVVSAPQAALLVARGILPLFKPDLVLYQSHDSERMFNKLGFASDFLPNGVDVDEFTPFSAEERLALRQRYGIPPDKFVIVHVGPVKEGRNIRRLKELQGNGNQVLIVGRPSESGESGLNQELSRAGCLVWTRYLPDIREVYGLSDCYVFPTTRAVSCIESPLSVLEAMSCNIPVVSTRFGALPRLFQDGDGFSFVDNAEEFPARVQSLKHNDRPVRTREKVLPFSWKEITARLESIYSSLLK